MPAPAPRRRRLALTCLVVLAAAACSSGHAADRPATTSLPSQTWSQVLAAARGQTVHWFMYGGDDVLNAFVTGPLAHRLTRYGVSLDQVRVTDTVDAVNRVLAEKQAGRRSSGAVDLVWVNGENFSTGRQAGLWRCGYPSRLPNSRYVDSTAGAVTHDFGVPVDGCESPWQQADSALVYDAAKLSPADVASVTSLLAWAKAHPGRFTYPAPPDFTGSMVVRTLLYDTAASLGTPATDPAGVVGHADALWRRLDALAPSLWRHGSTYPTSQDDVERLYADGEVDAFFTYGPGSVAEKVRKGTFPRSTREAVPGVGNIANTSFVAIPFDAAHTAAAEVVANELLDPQVQLALLRADGAYPAVTLSRLPVPAQRELAAVDLGPSVLSVRQLTAHTLPELPASQVTALEAEWKQRVQHR